MWWHFPLCPHCYRWTTPCWGRAGHPPCSPGLPWRLHFTPGASDCSMFKAFSLSGREDSGSYQPGLAWLQAPSAKIRVDSSGGERPQREGRNSCLTPPGGQGWAGQPGTPRGSAGSSLTAGDLSAGKTVGTPPSRDHRRTWGGTHRSRAHKELCRNKWESMDVGR